MEIKCEYLDGTIKEFPKKTYKHVLNNIVEATKKKKGVTYIKFLESNLNKVYVDGKLVLDRSLILKQEKHY